MSFTAAIPQEQASYIIKRLGSWVLPVKLSKLRSALLYFLFIYFRWNFIIETKKHTILARQRVHVYVMSIIHVFIKTFTILGINNLNRSAAMAIPCVLVHSVTSKAMF